MIVQRCSAIKLNNQKTRDVVCVEFKQKQMTEHPEAASRYLSIELGATDIRTLSKAVLNFPEYLNVTAQTNLFWSLMIWNVSGEFKIDPDVAQDVIFVLSAILGGYVSLKSQESMDTAECVPLDTQAKSLVDLIDLFVGAKAVVQAEAN